MKIDFINRIRELEHKVAELTKCTEGKVYEHQAEAFKFMKDDEAWNEIAAYFDSLEQQITELSNRVSSLEIHVSEFTRDYLSSRGHHSQQIPPDGSHDHTQGMHEQGFNLWAFVLNRKL